MEVDCGRCVGPSRDVCVQVSVKMTDGLLQFRWNTYKK
jgi:hypothetical protein